MKRQKQTTIFILYIICILGLVGCAASRSLSVTTSNILESSAITYNEARKSLAALDAKKLLTKEQKIEIIKHAENFWIAYHVAFDAYELYLETKDKQTIHSSLAALSKALGSFLEYARKIESKKEK